MKLLTIIVIAFLIFGGFLTVKYNNYKLDNPDDVVSFTKDYGKWLFGVGKSAVAVTGAAIQEQWLPQRNDTKETNQTNETIVIYHD